MMIHAVVFQTLFVVSIKEVVLLVFSGQRAGMLLKIKQCTGHPPTIQGHPAPNTDSVELRTPVRESRLTTCKSQGMAADIHDFDPDLLGKHQLIISTLSTVMHSTKIYVKVVKICSDLGLQDMFQLSKKLVYVKDLTSKQCQMQEVLKKGKTSLQFSYCSTIIKKHFWFIGSIFAQRDFFFFKVLKQTVVWTSGPQ